MSCEGSRSTKTSRGIVTPHPDVSMAASARISSRFSSSMKVCLHRPCATMTSSMSVASTTESSLLPAILIDVLDSQSVKHGFGLKAM